LGELPLRLRAGPGWRAWWRRRPDGLRPRAQLARWSAAGGQGRNRGSEPLASRLSAALRPTWRRSPVATGRRLR